MEMENHSLEMKINELENKIDFLSSQLLSHIEFINKTYDTMRAPLLFFCEKINRLREMQFPTSLTFKSIFKIEQSKENEVVE